MSGIRSGELAFAEEAGGAYHATDGIVASGSMDSLLGKEMLKWRQTFPGGEKQWVMVLGIFYHRLSLNVQPEVDYGV